MERILQTGSCLLAADIHVGFCPWVGSGITQLCPTCAIALREGNLLPELGCSIHSLEDPEDRSTETGAEQVWGSRRDGGLGKIVLCLCPFWPCPALCLGWSSLPTASEVPCWSPGFCIFWATGWGSSAAHSSFSVCHPTPAGLGDVLGAPGLHSWVPSTVHDPNQCCCLQSWLQGPCSHSAGDHCPLGLLFPREVMQEKRPVC